MERYLDLDEIAKAMGNTANLPSPKELQQLMVDAEMAMFIGKSNIPEDLLKTAWLMHSIGTSRASLNLYGPERRKRASQISSHIFDLVLDKGLDNHGDQMVYTFAAQLGYIKGDLNPNASALYGKLNHKSEIRILDSFETVAIELGVMFLALDRARLFRIIPSVQAQLDELEDIDSNDDKYQVIVSLTDSIWYATLYLTYGTRENLTRAISILEEVVRSDEYSGPLEARWVAANILSIIEDFGDTSLWSIMPPEVPPSAVRALSLGSPPVLTLWPPQVGLLKGRERSPLLLENRRTIISVPTSAGKTLIAQLFISSHLAQGGGGVCVVAPSHSLCREISSSLAQRLRFMNYEVINNMPEQLEDELSLTANVEVMTPERLNFLIRNDIKALLDRFTLFIIDEAHLLNQETRGWNLEASLSLLNDISLSSNLRIILMSAALGVQGHISTWLKADSEVYSYHSDWRGPRRLYAMFSPELDYNIPKPDIPATLRRRYPMRQVSLKGVVRLRIAESDKIHKVYLSKPVGQVLLKPDGSRHINSTKQYVSLVPLILSVAETGPVLIIENSKTQAMSTAKAIAANISVEPEHSKNISEFAKLRLGEEHSLPKVLAKGVAYHHSSLPADIQDSIESSIRRGELKYVVSTTSLAEGINLPVRTVVVSHTGGFRNGEFEEFIKGSTLLNAIGRAGRAGKETEGWIILNGIFDSDKLAKLVDASQDELAISSNLLSESYLNALAQFEIAVAEAEDNIFKMPNNEMSGFISHIWSVISSYEDLKGIIDVEDINSFMHSTLAFTQLDEVTKQRWLEASRVISNIYRETNFDARKRWAKSGTSLPTSIKLESISKQIFENILKVYIDDNNQMSLSELIEAFFGNSIIDLYLSTPESGNDHKLKPHRSTSDTIQDFDHIGMLCDWIDGMGLDILIEKYLSEINSVEYAYESLGNYTTSIYEHYLPWIIGILVKWVNSYEQAFTEGRPLVDPLLPYYIKYGVNSKIAVNLMLGGIRSRRFAALLAQKYVDASDAGYELNSWLESNSIDTLVDDFGASSSELADYVGYVSPNESNFLSDLIERQFSRITIFGSYQFNEDELLISKKATRLGNDTISLYQFDGKSSELPIKHHREFEQLIDTGIPYEITVEAIEEYQMTLLFNLVDYDL